MDCSFRRPTLVGLAPALVLALVASGCSGDNSVGPMKPADPLATAAHIEALNTSFGSPTFQSFAFAGSWSPAAAPVRPLRTLLQIAQPTIGAHRALSPAETRLAAATLAAALAPPPPGRAGAIAATVLPPNILGTTYEWNGSAYAATSRAGAPPDGVRFILYALDLSGQPIVTSEIGYADLIDKSTSSVQSLQILVVGTTTVPPVTYLDYTVTATTTTVSVVGFITDGAHRLDFNVAVSSGASSYVIDIRFDVNADNAHVRLNLTLTAPDANTFKLAVDFRLQFGSEVVTVTGTDILDVNTGSESGTLTVRVNGGIYATITITNGVPSFAGGGGQVLTADDLTALNAIFDAIATSVQRFDELLAPAGSLGV